MFIRILFFCLLSIYTLAQPARDSVSKAESKLKVSAYLDPYFVYSFNQSSIDEQADFIFNHKRQNEFNVNLALIFVQYKSGNIRASLGQQAGTYPTYNYSSEQGLVRMIYEAQAGARLIKNLWLDAGIFPSHIGFEFPIGKNNWTLTRSIMAENTPYYESGAKLSWESEDKWAIRFLVLNGWQIIRESNSNKAIGTQFQYSLSENLLFNSSSFVGNEKPDSAKQMRYFHDFYVTYGTNKKLGLTAAFDFGFEEKNKTAGYNKWYNITIITRYKLHSKIHAAARAEYYDDKNGVIIPSAFSTGFKTFGYSLNLDYLQSENLTLRAEIKTFNSNNKIFKKDSGFDYKSLLLSSTLAVSF